jgi:hypothetical protein
MTTINRDLINEARLEAFHSQPGVYIDADMTEDDVIETSTPSSPIVKKKMIRIKKSPRMKTALIEEPIEEPIKELIEEPIKELIEEPIKEPIEEKWVHTTTHHFDITDEETYAPYYAELLGGGLWETMGIDKLRACMKVFGVGLSRMKICSIPLQIRRGRCLQVIEKYLNADDCDTLKCMEINEILKPNKDKKKKTKEEVLGSGIVEYKLKL